MLYEMHAELKHEIAEVLVDDVDSSSCFDDADAGFKYSIDGLRHFGHVHPWSADDWLW